MAQLDAKDRRHIDKSKFAYVDRDGVGHLPIEDEAHVRNAVARWNQTHFESAADREGARKKIVAAARKHGIEIADDDHVAHPARTT